MKIKFVCLLAVMLQTVVSMAQPRSESDAISVAQDFWGSNRHTLKAVPRTNIAMAKVKARITSNTIPASTQPGYYVINDEANNRFVIVSGDERLYKILGYSDNGIFNAETVPYGLLEMLEGYDRQYRSVAPYLDEIGYAGTRSKTIAIQPLIKTKWGQQAPFNNECPVNPNSNSGDKCAAGCGATAMAQIMNYYKYPECGAGNFSYTTDSLKIYQEMDFAAYHPDWDNMLNHYFAGSTDVQKEAVAALTHACGVSLSSDYNRSTGVVSFLPAFSLSHFWKYNSNISYKLKYYYNDEEWNQIIRKDLMDGHPIFYLGTGDAGGHGFILDGCDDAGLYHFNFGWDGIGDGYYSLDAIAPCYPAGYSFLSWGPIGIFSSNQIMICHIAPETYGMPAGEFYATNSLGLERVKAGEDISVSSELLNLNADSYEEIKDSPLFKGEFGVGLFNHDFEFITSLAGWEAPEYGAQGVEAEGTFRLDASLFDDGTQYYIAYYGYSDKSGYSIARTKNGQEDYYLATLVGDSITFEPMKKMELAPSHMDVWVENNVAGELENRVSESDKNTARKWYISGELNGTDICFLKEVLAQGVMTNLDLSHASIVKGGLPYITRYSKEYYTEDNVIGDYMFEEATSLKKIILPPSVRKIGEYAFQKSALEDVVMPEGLDTIGRYAFYNCKNLLAANIPQSVTRIEDNAFSYCEEFTQFIIPDKVEYVADILNYCPKLRTIHIGAAVNSFEGSCFDDTSLQSFTVSEDNRYYKAIDGVLYTRDMTCIVRCPLALSADEFVLGHDITSIGEEAFRGCKNIRKIRLPEGVRVINDCAIANSGVESLNLPASLIKIGSWIFFDCERLSEIDSDIEQYVNYLLSDALIRHISPDCVWYVPAGCSEDYKNSSWWVPTWQIVEKSPTGIEQTADAEGVKVTAGDGSLTIQSCANATVAIYNIQGELIREVHLSPKGQKTIALPRGIYIVNRCKYYVK